MTNVDTVIIGAGQAGLAASWFLQVLGREHVVLERGRVAERWRSERWDSLRALTPNWMTRLPGAAYDGPDPDGFMTMPELVRYFAFYAQSFDAPVIEGTTVRSVVRYGDRFEVDTGSHRWWARHVVIATGWADRPHIPAIAARLPARVQQLTPTEYRNPGEIAGDRVLVVGASASGVQIAAELASAGRTVTLAVGRHRPAPRHYRGADIMRWLDRLGKLDRAPADDGERLRLLHEPSLQLSGSGPVDLATLAAHGVMLAGRLVDVDPEACIARFAGDLATSVADARHRIDRLLEEIDPIADELGAPPSSPVGAVDTATEVEFAPLGRGGIDAVVWATGFSRSYSWLHVPVLDDTGEIMHRRGCTPIPGLFTVGMRFQSGRRSTFIDGARLDAAVVAEAIDTSDARARVA